MSERIPLTRLAREILAGIWNVNDPGVQDVIRRFYQEADDVSYLRKELEEMQAKDVAKTLGYERKPLDLHELTAMEVSNMGAAADEAARRKQTPIWSGVMQYFPKVWEHIARASWQGNQQHNPGQPLHWAREKSTDQMDAALRHMLDHAEGALDTDGQYHLAKAIWRLCAEFELYLEKEGK
jgi:hypothetical protein